MATLLVQGCSKSKLETSSPIEAFDLYTGYYFKIIKKAKRNDSFDDRIDLRILSAEHGLLSPVDKIVTYDKRMDTCRAKELREDVLTSLGTLCEGERYAKVIVNAGQAYELALEGLEHRVAAPVEWLSGGLGERGAQLKRLVRGPSIEQAQA